VFDVLVMDTTVYWQCLASSFSPGNDFVCFILWSKNVTLFISLWFLQTL